MTPIDDLKSLPQHAVLSRAVEQLKADETVAAIWLGGSLASGDGDRYSDVDLRIAVRGESLDAWRTRDLSSVFGQAIVGAKVQAFGPEALLHHLVVGDGTIVDLFVQTTGHENLEKRVQVIACRDEVFAARLAGFERPPAEEYLPAEAAVIRQAIVEFWLDSHKHRRVLDRGLDVLVLTGLHIDRAVLSRLWYTLISGLDVGNRRPTIHGMSRMSRAVQDHYGQVALEVLGARTDSREAIVGAIERVRDEVSKTGKALSTRMGFEYPDALEQTVRRGWEEFLQNPAAARG